MNMNLAFASQLNDVAEETNRQTDTQNNYHNPHCTCLPRLRDVKHRDFPVGRPNKMLDSNPIAHAHILLNS